VVEGLTASMSLAAMGVKYGVVEGLTAAMSLAAMGAKSGVAERHLGLADCRYSRCPWSPDAAARRARPPTTATAVLTTSPRRPTWIAFRATSPLPSSSSRLTIASCSRVGRCRQVLFHHVYVVL